MEQKPEAKHAVLTEQLGAGMDALDALAQKRHTQDQEKLVHARKNVQPLVERAVELKAEFEGLLKEFGA